MLLRVLYLSFADISVRSSRILKLFGPEYILCTCSHNNSSLQYNNAVRGHRAGFNNFFFFSSFFSFFPSLLLSSSTRRRFYTQRPSGQAVVTGVVPSPPRYVPSIFIAHRVQHSHSSSIFIECC